MLDADLRDPGGYATQVAGTRSQMVAGSGVALASKPVRETGRPNLGAKHAMQIGIKTAIKTRQHNLPSREPPTKPVIQHRLYV